MIEFNTKLKVQTICTYCNRKLSSMHQGIDSNGSHLVRVVKCGCDMAQKKTEEAEPSASNNISSDAILAAGNNWYDRSHGGSLDGFIAGAKWAQEQHTC